MSPLSLLLSDCWPAYRERTQRSKSLEIARHARKARNARNARNAWNVRNGHFGPSNPIIRLFTQGSDRDHVDNLEAAHPVPKTSLNMLKVREMFILVLGAQEAFCAQWVFGCQDAEMLKMLEMLKSQNRLSKVSFLHFWV